MFIRKKITTLCAALVFSGAVVSCTAGAQELDSARDVLEANIEATGGQDAWESINDMYMESEVLFEMQQGVLVLTNESWRVLPGYMLTFTDFIEGPPQVPASAVESTVYITPDGGFFESAQGRQEVADMPPEQLASFRTSTAKNEIDYLAYPDSSLIFHGIEEVEGQESYAIEVVGSGSSKMFYSTDTHLLIAREGTSPAGGTAMTVMTDYEDVGDVKMAFVQETDLGQVGIQTVEVQDVEINEGLTPETMRSMVDERQQAGGDGQGR